MGGFHPSMGKGAAEADNPWSYHISVRRHVYDVLLAYSDGKDSTNIRHTTDNLWVTSVMVRPPLPLIQKAFAATAAQDIYSPETMDRARSTCTTCIGFVKSNDPGDRPGDP